MNEIHVIIYHTYTVENMDIVFMSYLIRSLRSTSLALALHCRFGRCSIHKSYYELESIRFTEYIFRVVHSFVG